MGPVKKLLTRVTRMGAIRVISQPAAPIIKNELTRSTLQQQAQRRYVQRMDQYRRKTTAWQSMREFFMHPLTWDRNNGYLNVVLALAIFSFVFLQSCSPCPEDRVPQTKSKD